MRPPATSSGFPYTTLFRSDLLGRQADQGADVRDRDLQVGQAEVGRPGQPQLAEPPPAARVEHGPGRVRLPGDRKSTRLNSCHLVSSYAVFCLKKKINRRAL